MNVLFESHPVPAFAVDDVPDVPAGQAKLVGKVTLPFSRGRAVADRCHDFPVRNSVPVTLTPVPLAIEQPVLEVLLPSAPHQVLRPAAVSLDVIKVPRLLARRTGAGECLKHEKVHRPGYRPSTGPAQLDCRISARRGGLPERPAFVRADCGAASRFPAAWHFNDYFPVQATDPSTVADLVKPFPAGNGQPAFVRLLHSRHTSHPGSAVRPGRCATTASGPSLRSSSSFYSNTAYFPVRTL